MAKNTVIVSITGETRGLQSALGKASSSLSGLAKGAGIAVAAVGLLTAALGVKAIKSASNLEQAMGALESVFKDQTGTMTEFAKKAAQSVGLAQSEYAQLASVLGSQLKNLGLPMDQISGKTNDLIGLGADLAAQFGGSTSDAVSALSSLLRGERDPIERYGVSINDARIQAKLAEMGLSGLTGEALANAKTTATLALLYEQTADAQGAFSRESTTLAGSLQRLKAGAENLSSTFGVALLPAATAIVAALAKVIDVVSNSPIFQTFTAAISTASSQFADWVFGVLNGTKSLSSLKFDFSGIDFSAAIASFNTFRNSVISQAPEIITGLIDGIVSAATQIAAVAPKLIAALIRGLISALPTLVTAAVDLIKGIVQGLTEGIPVLLQALANLIPVIIGQLLLAIPQLIIAAQDLFEALVVGLAQAVPALIQGLVDMFSQVLPVIMQQWPAVMQNGVDLFLALVTSIATALPQIVDAMTNAWPSILDAITAALPQILEAGTTAFLGIVEAVGKALPSILTAVIAMSPRIASSIIQMTPALLAAGIQLFLAIVKAIPVILPQVMASLRDMGPELGSAVRSIAPTLVSAGIDLVGGLVRGITSSAGRVVSALTGIAGGAINAFKGMFGIKSPSRLFMKYGKYIDQGLAIGITGNVGVIDSAMSRLNGRVVGGFDPSLTSGDYGFSGTGVSSSAAPAVYNINLSTLNATPETGRVIVESIRDYERAGGRR